MGVKMPHNLVGHLRSLQGQRGLGTPSFPGTVWRLYQRVGPGPSSPPRNGSAVRAGQTMIRLSEASHRRAQFGKLAMPYRDEWSRHIRAGQRGCPNAGELSRTVASARWTRDRPRSCKVHEPAMTVTQRGPTGGESGGPLTVDPVHLGTVPERYSGCSFCVPHAVGRPSGSG
jgi:hypothetical protein